MLLDDITVLIFSPQTQIKLNSRILHSCLLVTISSWGIYPGCFQTSEIKGDIFLQHAKSSQRKHNSYLSIINSNKWLECLPLIKKQRVSFSMSCLTPDFPWLVGTNLQKYLTMYDSGTVGLAQFKNFLDCLASCPICKYKWTNTVLYIYMFA